MATYRCQVGKNGYHEQRYRIEEANGGEENPAHGLLASNLSRRLIQVVPDLNERERPVWPK